VTGTYQWDVAYTGDANNGSASETNATSEQVTVSPASPMLTYTGTDQVGTGSSFVPTATLTGVAQSCAAGQLVTFSLSSNPLNGTVGAFNLGSGSTSAAGVATGPSVPTTGWQDGAYMITASYAGTANCNAAAGSGTLAVTTTGQAAFGDGRYSVPSLGATSFGFEVQLKSGSTTKFTGQLDVVTAKKWRFEANVTSFDESSPTQAIIAGKGKLYWWNPSLNNGRGDWALAKKGVTYLATANAATAGAPASFGIYISYTPVAPQPALPGYGPRNLRSGGITIS
jgi:hypothetical protein